MQEPSCDRCGEENTATIMSYFNTDTLCMACKEKERAHPDFERAREAEIAEVQKGNYNYPGIGKPADL